MPLSSSLLLEESLELELELERLSSSSLSLELLSGCFVVDEIVVVVELKLLLSRCRHNDVFFRAVIVVVIERDSDKNMGE